jgi:hypothetical protein
MFLERPQDEPRIRVRYVAQIHDKHGLVQGRSAKALPSLRLNEYSYNRFGLNRLVNRDAADGFVLISW